MTKALLCSILALGHLDPEALNLLWDSALGFPGCYSVKQTARIISEPT